MKPIHLTKKAADKVKTIMVEEKIEGQFLRVGVRGGGCAGMEFLLDFIKDANENDYSYQSEGVNVVVDEISATYLMGTEIDYVDGLNESGFKFNNDSLKRRCGCNKSFNPE